MTRTALQRYIEETYSTLPEYLWTKYPTYAVFRHSGNQKWFALVADISKQKLGLPDKDVIDILNVKCDPLLIASLHGTPGIYPAYHMNKATWLTLALDGSVDDEKIKGLLDMSYRLTARA